MLEWIMENWQFLVEVAFGALSLAAIIVDRTPSEKDNKIVRKIKSVLEKLFGERGPVKL